MLTDQKIQDLLIHVWNPKIDLSHADKTEKLNELIQQIYALLESRYGSEEALSDFLKNQSIQYFNAEILEEKSLETAKLMMNWYMPIPAIWTDFGRVKIQISNSRFFDYDFFVYQSDTVNEYIGFDCINQGEISINFEKIDLPEVEKSQLINAIRELIKPSKLIFFNVNTV